MTGKLVCLAQLEMTSSVVRLLRPIPMPVGEPNNLSTKRLSWQHLPIQRSESPHPMGSSPMLKLAPVPPCRIQQPPWLARSFASLRRYALVAP
eukprot:scaffold8288_cov30-Tisochrysis_lutea.AAC.4